MSDSRLPGRGRLAMNRRPGLMPLVLALTALMGGVPLQSSVAVAAQESGQLFRCETEEDLDGSACRVDMLPDSALAAMVYERGFDPEGADRIVLLDAVMQLLDYEVATGEDLREMEYIPDADGSAAAAAAAADAADADAATALAADDAAAAAAAAAAATATAEEAAVGTAAAGGSGTLSGENGCPANEQAYFDDGGTDGEEGSVPPSTGGAAAAAAIAATKAEKSAEEEALREVIEESSSSSSGGDGGGEGEDDGEAEKFSDDGTVVGYACNLLSEVLQTMKRDLNAVVGFLPAPVAKPIREVAAVASDTAVRFVGPALRQAERYTRGLRREARHAAGRAALRLKDDVGPWVARGVAAGFGKAKQRLGEAVEKRRGRGEGGEVEEEGRGGAGEGQEKRQ